MALRKVDVKALDNIVEKMIDTVDWSKDEIFQIGEQCRNDYDSFVAELQDIKKEVKHVIEEGDSLETKSKLARQRLSAVSKHFKDFSGRSSQGIWAGAWTAHETSYQDRQLEQQQRKRRDHLERRLKSLQETINRRNLLYLKLQSCLIILLVI